MKNYRLVRCCHNCKYFDDIAIDDVPIMVCCWYYDHMDEIPADHRVSDDGVCDYHEETKHE